MAELVELDRAGEGGGGLTKEAAPGGEGAVMELVESLWRWLAPLWNGDGGENTPEGLGIGVFWFDEAPPEDTGCRGPISPVYGAPNSPGKNDSVEQNPSDEDMSNVKPSVDL